MSRDTFWTHFVPVTLCVTQETRRNRRPYDVTHNVTGTKCVTVPQSALPYSGMMPMCSARILRPIRMRTTPPTTVAVRS